MGRWADIRTRVKTIVGDTADADAQTWVLDAARELNAEARFLSTAVSIGTTTTGVGQYTLPANTVDLYSVLVDGSPYDLTTEATIERIDAGIDRVRGGGVFAADYSSTGALQVEIRPAPDETGLAITGRSVIAIAAPTWASDDPPWPEDFDQVVATGAAAIGLAEADGRLDMAQFYREQFERGVSRLRGRKNSRVGRGPIRMRVRRD